MTKKKVSKKSAQAPAMNTTPEVPENVIASVAALVADNSSTVSPVADKAKPVAKKSKKGKVDLKLVAKPETKPPEPAPEVKAAAPEIVNPAAPVAEAETKPARTKANVIKSASFAKDPSGALFFVESPQSFIESGGVLETTYNAGDKLIIDNPRSKFHGLEVEFVHYSLIYKCLRNKCAESKYTVDVEPSQVTKVT